MSRPQDHVALPRDVDFDTVDTGSLTTDTLVANGPGNFVNGYATTAQATYTAGTGVSIAGNVVSNTQPTITAGTGISVSGGVVTNTQPTITAGTGISVVSGVVTNTQPEITAGTGISVVGGVVTNTNVGNSAFTSAVTTSNTTASTSKTTGSGKFAGGLGVAGDVYANTLNISNASTTGVTAQTCLTPNLAAGQIFNLRYGVATSTGNSLEMQYTYQGSNNSSNNMKFQHYAKGASMQINFPQASTSTTTGSVVVTQGLGVSGDIYASTANTTSTTDATSSTTGASKHAGGISSQKSIYAGTGFRSRNGTFTLSTTPATVHTIVSGTRGFITITSTVGSGSAMAFFEWTSGTTTAFVSKITQAGTVSYDFTISTQNIQVACASGGPDAAASYFVTLL